jgi:Fic family protein
MIMNGRTDLRTIGAYRTHDEPMQIVSGPVHAPKVHFEAPASTRLPAEMAAYWKWLDVSGPKGDAPAAPVSRAGVAHIWFESIHPYEDGNGRLGRAISEKVLAQGFPTPAVTGMATTLLRHRKAYYAQLEHAHCDLDVTDWLLWFAAKAIEAQRRTLQKLEFVLEKSRLMDRLRGQLNPRQEKALLRLFAAGPDGFAGGLSAANYMSITGAPSATTTRDLTALVAMSALTRTGEHRSTRYRLNIEIEPLRSVEVSDIL